MTDLATGLSVGDEVMHNGIMVRVDHVISADPAEYETTPLGRVAGVQGPAGQDGQDGAGGGVSSGINVWLDDYADLAAAITAAEADNGVIGVRGTNTVSYGEFSGPLPTQNIVLQGTNPQSSIIDGNGAASMMRCDGMRLTLMNLTVRDYSRDAIYFPTTGVCSAFAYDCIFEDVGMGSPGVPYNDRWGALSTSGQGGAGTIEQMRVSRCNFVDCFIGINLRADQARNLSVENCFFTSNGGMSGITIGDDPQSVKGGQTQWNITNNIFKDITNSLGLAETHAVQVLGVGRVVMTGNNITNIDGGGGTEGVYFKAENSVFSNNIVIDAGGNDYGAVTLKKYTYLNPSLTYGSGEPTIVSNNIIGFTEDHQTAHPSWETTCIQSNSNGDNHYKDNILFGFSDQGMNLLSCGESWIDGNEFRDSFGSNPYAVALRGQPPSPQTTPAQTGASGSRITNNKFLRINGSGGTAYAIWVISSNNGGTTAELDDFEIKDNTIRETDVAIRVNCNTGSTPGRRMAIIGNHIYDATTGIQLAGSINDLVRHGNRFYSVGTEYAGITPTTLITSSADYIQ